MIAENRLKTARKLLKTHRQSRLLAFWEQLAPDQRAGLLDQIERLDFSRIDLWAANAVAKSPSVDFSATLAPAPFYGHAPDSPEQKTMYARARELGKECISAGKVAAFVVAGGQGTRLGFDGPKGDLPVSPVRNKTLFQLFAETIAAVSRRYNVTCPWYIMTSPLNNRQTREIFHRNDYFGLKNDDVFIFQQGTLPNFDFDGRILLADKANLSCSPDGHGGSLRALFTSGALDDMKKRGIELISYFQVDNPLVNIFDPLFIGLHMLDQAEMSSKALLKTGPTEKVGNFCLVDGRVTVIEYSDLPDELAARRNDDGSLFFQLGSIAIHIINTTFVERLNAEGFALPLHRAVKKIPHIDQQGNSIDPAEPNGVKLESFVFDALPLASRSVILQTLRDEEFAPVKNATGPDSLETARQMMVARAADWLESARIAVPRKPDGSPDCLIEIAPAFASEKDDINEKAEQIPNIKPGDKLYLG
ncbi:MAG TPA: UDPGP type 1 family protein [Sedimentisphaerales bacterium]|nr:UDPGP type 1 family protein [Sedimentisphaerales bacterium]